MGFSEEDELARAEAQRHKRPYRYWFDHIRNTLTGLYREGSPHIVLKYSTSQRREEYIDDLSRKLYETYGEAASVARDPEYYPGVIITLTVTA